MPDVARRVVGRYEILRELGRGRASTVHLARRTDLDRYVALKEFHAIGLGSPEFPSQVLRVAGSLSHPGIVTVFDCFERDGTAYVAMEYVERGSLRPYVGRMTLAQIGAVLESLLAALRYAQAHGIAHRDLEPENVLVTAEGRVKIAGFGVPDTTQTLDCVGRIALELFTGRTPIDAELSDWIERLLVTHHAGDAWATLEEILVWRLGPLWRRDALLVVAAPEPVTPADPVAPRPPRARRRWALAIAAGIAAVTGVAATALGTDRERRGSPTAQPVLLSARGIAVEVPAGWSRDRGPEPGVPGVDHGVVARGPAGERIVFGRGDWSWSNHHLLPNALRAGRTAIRTGGRTVRYDGVRIAGRAAFVYSAPTTKGVATVTCFAAEPTCSAIGASLHVTAGKALPLGPDAAFISDVGRVLGWLEARERPAAARLRQARTPADRVAATKKLWWTYAGASKRLRQLDVTPADRMVRRQLAEALRLAGCAYGRAAGHDDRAGYEREGELALVHQADVRRALDGLRDAGYTLPPDAAGAARFTRLPALATAE